MSKIIDITDKLNFDSKPKIKIKDKEFEVNNTAVTMLKVLPKFENPSVSDLYDVYTLLFSSKAQAEIEKLNLDMSDFTQLIASAVELVAGSDTTSDEGETVTPDMT